MVVTRMSPKHQTTLAMEYVKLLGLVAGVRLKQWVEGNRIILEPIPDIMDSFGGFSKPSGMKKLSAKQEKNAMEMAVAKEVEGK